MISLQEYKNSKSVKSLVQKLFESRQVAHNCHLQTNSYAEHKALQGYYENILEFIDTFVECYQGQYGILKDYEKIDVTIVKDIATYLEDCVKIFILGRDSIKDSHLKNIMDEIITLSYQTLYKIKYLK